MIDFNLKYSIDIYTSENDENYARHISEDNFYRYFLVIKDAWKQDFIRSHSLDFFDFITRKFSMQISRELFHPATVHIILEEVKYEKLSLELFFAMYHHEKKIASSVYELVPVDTRIRKVISKSSLYEKVQFN